MPEPTRAKWTLGYTMNLGNFQSLRIDCEISASAQENETATELSSRVYKLVETQLVKKIQEAKKELE